MTSLAPVLLCAALVILGACSGPATRRTPTERDMDPSGSDGGGGEQGGTSDSGAPIAADASAPIALDASAPRDAGTVRHDSSVEPIDAATDAEVEPPPADPLAFRYAKVLVYRDKAVYNPTDEFIFASVIETTHIASPLGRYYLYYAPHDAPGGISLAYADDIEGPYTEYPANPLVSNTHQGRFSVTHVSSPHVVWMEQYSKYFLYFHGENTTTRWAHSTDGLSWELAEDNVAINTAAWSSSFPGRSFSESSYARVFEYTIPGIGDRYTLLTMLIEKGFGRRIALATSSDGKHFTPRDPALISPAAGEGSDVSGAFYLPYEGRHLVIYHGSSGNLYSTDVGERFDQEEHQGVFYDPQPYYPEYDKASAPFFIEVGGRLHFFYDVGPRLDQTIALAVQTPSDNVQVDNGTSGFSTGGAWAASTSTEGYFGADYLRDESEEANPGAWARWQPTFAQSGFYKVYARWPALANRPNRIRYEVTHQGVVTEVFADQTDQRGSWVELGRFRFDAGSSEQNRLVLDAASDTGFAVADAAWFVFDP